MKVTFLGTGTSQGVPVIGCTCKVCTSSSKKDKRLRSSILVQIESKNIVVDSGPDFRQQMLNAGINKLDALLLTHSHKDHIAGLDDIRAFNFIQKEAINVFATQQVEAQLKMEFAYIFDHVKYPGIPELNIHTIKANEDFVAAGLPITPIEVLHYKLPVLGFKFNKFVYITDANYIHPNEIEKIKNCEVLVLNALRLEKHISHFTLNEAIQMVKEINPRKAYFTHISHQLGLHQQVSETLPQNIHLAYDGLTIQL
jgi:phosphoribosyl 1,2-cyclic phosphate phosphodiesterase